MDKFDDDLDPGALAGVLSALDKARSTGLLADHLEQTRRQFAWGQPEDFYRGFVNGLLAAADLLRRTPDVERPLLGTMLLLQAGVVLKHLGGESPNRRSRSARAGVPSAGPAGSPPGSSPGRRPDAAPPG